MRITSINLAGSIEKGKRLPRAFARVSRAIDSDYIEVETLAPDGALCRTHLVAPDCEEDIRCEAEQLQRILDGCAGTNTDIEEYVRVLQHFAD
ncbi:MAG: hypothetical protein ISS78_09695 [Phycisphaerae bacterium]|nr:hypothetical protein [Phycisphaerae bacterium]